MKPRDPAAEHRLFLLLCAILGLVSLLVLVAGSNFISDLMALITFWALLFGIRYLVRALPVVYHYFRDLHKLHAELDLTQQDETYQGKGLTPEEAAAFDALTRHMKE